MTARDEEAFDAFVRVWSVWWSGVPDGLRRQESSLVVRLLSLGLRQGGISQSEIKRELEIAQPRLSKLMVKLLNAKWIEVKNSKTDRRVKLITTSAKARDRMASLKQDMKTVLRAQEVGQAPKTQTKPARFRLGKAVRVQEGQTGFFGKNGEPVELD